MRTSIHTAAGGFGGALIAAALLAGCQGSTDGEGTVTAQGDVPIVYAKRVNTLSLAPTNGTVSDDGGDLMLREKSSPSAPEHNLTAAITQGNGDASDPEVSYDGKKVVFALRCPTSNTSTIGGQPACTGRWNIWEYDMSAGGPLHKGTLRRITASTAHDDVDPAYLPAGRGFVFASNRQAKSSLKQALGRSYFALDEYERERVLNLHTMTAGGEAIQQITFNQSHDRNPVVRENGDIMFARWEHVADRNRFAVFRTKPDGTDLFVLYGAQSPGNSFLHPREMDPAGPYKGFLTSSLMPLSGSQEGGALMIVDAANYSEYNTPASSSVPSQGGQVQATVEPLDMGRGLSFNGRATAPYPLWDGSNRILVSWRPCEVRRGTDVVPCTTLSSAELDRLASDRSEADEAADELQDDVPASYAVYMFDPVPQTWLIVAAPPPGFMYVDPVPLQARKEPNATDPTNVDPALAAQDLALIEVRSVYDTDGLRRMGEPMLTAADLPGGCGTGIATRAPEEPGDTRSFVADLRRMKDPADPAYHCAPVRFIRAVRAIAPPSSTMGLRSAIGETEFEQQQILGYGTIEPDGSFKLQVPADIPLALQVVDADGRAFQTHTNWIQVRPGERRTCDGCHSPRRGAALNSGAVVNTLPAALKTTLSAQHEQGETMASLRTRLEAALLTLQADPVFTDVWADTTRSGVAARASISLRYTGNPDPADDLATAVPQNGVINYPDHIQPLWTRPRGTAGALTCTNCHADAARLDLRGTVAGTGRLVSYEELLIGDPQIDPVTGQPVTRIREGVPEIQRVAPLVETSSGASNTAGQARKSRLTEILWGQTLLAGSAARTAHPNPPDTAPNHATLLNRAEKRLLAEWIDLGGQYYNDPFAPGGGVRAVTALSQQSFEQQVYPIMRQTCMGACHQPGGDGSAGGFRGNRLILTGDAEGDYNVTLTMVNDACSPANNLLLMRPSTVPHPAGALTQTTAVLPVGSTPYATIASWIARGCPNP
jgi:Hydrazine synthase alpha subunit middle domain